MSNKNTTVARGTYPGATLYACMLQRLTVERRIALAFLCFVVHNVVVHAIDVVRNLQKFNTLMWISGAYGEDVPSHAGSWMGFKGVASGDGVVRGRAAHRERRKEKDVFFWIRQVRP